MKKALLWLLCGALWAPVAFGAIGSTPVTITSTSAACLGTIGSGVVGQLGPTAQFLVVKNESTSDTIAFRVGYNALPTAVANTAGNFTLLPGQEQSIITTALGGSYLACVSSGASTPATFLVY